MHKSEITWSKWFMQQYCVVTAFSLAPGSHTAKTEEQSVGAPLLNLGKLHEQVDKEQPQEPGPI